MNAELSAAAIDQWVGRRLRERRQALGLSQAKLACMMKRSLAQLRKYESGATRISASTLYGAARHLKVPIIFFYEGLPDTAPNGTMTTSAKRLIEAPDGLRAARIFAGIASPALRNRLLRVLRAMAGPPEAQHDEADSEPRSD